MPYLKKENPIWGKSTINFEKIDGGLYLSAVPDRCQACIDSRLIPETPPGIVREEIKELMIRLNSEYNIKVREVVPPKSWRPSGNYETCNCITPDHALTKMVAKAISTVTGKDAVIAGCPGATLAGQMIKRSTPAVICGPGSIEQAHTEDEWVDVKQIPCAARIYSILMAEMLWQGKGEKKQKIL